MVLLFFIQQKVPRGCPRKNVFFRIRNISKRKQASEKKHAEHCLRHLNKTACEICSVFDKVLFCVKYLPPFFHRTLQLVVFIFVFLKYSFTFSFLCLTLYTFLLLELNSVRFKPKGHDRPYVCTSSKSFTCRYICTQNLCKLCHHHFVWFPQLKFLFSQDYKYTQESFS